MVYFLNSVFKKSSSEDVHFERTNLRNDMIKQIVKSYFFKNAKSNYSNWIELKKICFLSRSNCFILV